MHNIPKILQTRADFDLCYDAAMAGEVQPIAVIPHFMGLLESAHCYVFDKELAEDEQAGKLPDYCECVDTSGDNPTRTQLKRQVDTSARLFVLGYSIAELDSIIATLENAHGSK